MGCEISLNQNLLMKYKFNEVCEGGKGKMIQNTKKLN